MSYSSLIYLLIQFATFQYILHSKEFDLITESDDSIQPQSDGNKETYCCAPMKATSKWINKCETLDSKFGCERKSNKCKWQECSRVGYCRWSGAAPGYDNKIADLCARQTNVANCVNKITDGSGKCEWIYGYPPIPTDPGSMGTTSDSNEYREEQQSNLLESDVKESYCCSRSKATPKWTTECPTFDSKFGCERIVNKCKWDLCSKVGYCQATGVNSGYSDQINNLCSRQTNIANCINKITEGSKNCEWVYGYPPTITSPPPQNEEFVNINNINHATSNKSFYGIEFIVLSLFLVSIWFITYNQCCINEYKSADVDLMKVTNDDERKALLSQI